MPISDSSPFAKPPSRTPILPSQVAMFVHGGEVYGVGTIQKMYAQELPDMLFVCLGEGPMLDWLREHHPRVMQVPGLARFVAGGSVATLGRMPGVMLQARRDARRLDSIFRDEGIRLVHTHWLPQQLIGVWLRRLGYRVVWQINNLTSHTRLMGMGLKLNHRFARVGADLLLPASDFIAANWRDSGVLIRTVRNAARPFHTSSNELPPAPVRCVIAGRLEESKGHHLAVQAVVAARKTGFEMSLDIFGGPIEGNPYADELRRLIAQAGGERAIALKGFANDLRQRHQSYHCGLQCRIDPEPCSLWVCETLVDGLPLVAAANGGTPELVEDGVTGLLFESGNAHDLGAKLLQLLSEPARLASMRKAAFARGAAMFTPDRFVRETFEAYSLLDGV